MLVLFCLVTAGIAVTLLLVIRMERNMDAAPGAAPPRVRTGRSPRCHTQAHAYAQAHRTVPAAGLHPGTRCLGGRGQHGCLSRRQPAAPDRPGQLA